MKLLDSLYPPTCLQCKKLLLKASLFCESCLEEFTLLEVKGRCFKCFIEIPQLEGVCKACRTKRHFLYRVGACFDPFGSPRTLFTSYLQGQTHFAKDLAAFMVVQLDRLKWGPLHFLTVVPTLFHNPMELIAKELSSLLHLPFLAAAKRLWNPSPTFSLKKRCNVYNQNVLLLDQESSVEGSLSLMAEVLDEAGSSAIYGLGVYLNQ